MQRAPRVRPLHAAQQQHHQRVAAVWLPAVGLLAPPMPATPVHPATLLLLLVPAPKSLCLLQRGRSTGSHRLHLPPTPQASASGAAAGTAASRAPRQPQGSGGLSATAPAAQQQVQQQQCAQATAAAAAAVAARHLQQRQLHVLGEPRCHQLGLSAAAQTLPHLRVQQQQLRQLQSPRGTPVAASSMVMVLQKPALSQLLWVSS